MASEPCRVDWSGPARRALPRPPDKVATAVVQFLCGLLADNPRRVWKPLALGMAGLFSARRGDYRVIYLINDDEHAVEVVAIEHRPRAYRRRTRKPR